MHVRDIQWIRSKRDLKSSQSCSSYVFSTVGYSFSKPLRIPFGYYQKDLFNRFSRGYRFYIWTPRVISVGKGCHPNALKTGSSKPQSKFSPLFFILFSILVGGRGDRYTLQIGCTQLRNPPNEYFQDMKITAWKWHSARGLYSVWLDMQSLPLSSPLPFYPPPTPSTIPLYCSHHAPYSYPSLYLYLSPHPPIPPLSTPLPYLLVFTLAI